MKYPRPSGRVITAGRIKWLATRIWLADGKPGVSMPQGVWLEGKARRSARRKRKVARRNARRNARNTGGVA